jgi:acetyltransferase
MVKELSHGQLEHFTHLDYDREMAFIATAPDATGKAETLGVVRAVLDLESHRSEFAIVVRSDLKRQGLGRALLDKMLRYCRNRGIREVTGQILRENRAMLGLVLSMGFRAVGGGTDEILEIRAALDSPIA